jgi:hypothetical protein
MMMFLKILKLPSGKIIPENLVSWTKIVNQKIFSVTFD